MVLFPEFFSLDLPSIFCFFKTPKSWGFGYPASLASSTAASVFRAKWQKNKEGNGGQQGSTHSLKSRLYRTRKISLPSGSWLLLVPVLVAAVTSIGFLRGQGAKEQKRERKKIKKKTLGISAPLLNIASSLSHALSQN